VSTDVAAYLRIGELAHRTGASPERLRAWERRYKLLRPLRTAGGFRLYTEEDERRVARMQEKLGAGLSAAEAARMALAEEAAGAGDAVEHGLDAVRVELLAALERYDEPEAQALLDRLLGSLGFATVIVDVVLPVLREIGERWRAGAVTVGQEHFASALLRGRLLGLARGWDHGIGPRALLACPPGERHDLGLIAFGLLLRREGWRVVFLGADTPLDTLCEAVRESRPAAVVLSAVNARRFAGSVNGIAAIARGTPVGLGGRGAAGRLGAALARLGLPQDPVEAAALLTRDYGK
jgi:DNA-binding transcriptional MerR regulator